MISCSVQIKLARWQASGPSTGRPAHEPFESWRATKKRARLGRCLECRRSSPPPSCSPVRTGGRGRSWTRSCPLRRTLACRGHVAGKAGTPNCTAARPPVRVAHRPRPHVGRVRALAGPRSNRRRSACRGRAANSVGAATWRADYGRHERAGQRPRGRSGSRTLVRPAWASQAWLTRARGARAPRRCCSRAAVVAVDAGPSPTRA